MTDIIDSQTEHRFAVLSFFVGKTCQQRMIFAKILKGFMDKSVFNKRGD